MKPEPQPPSAPRLLSVIPCRNEERAISTVEHLHVELRLNNVPHEIVPVDDGSTDSTWEVLQNLCSRIPLCAPCGTPPNTEFGRAIIFGIDRSEGDAVIVMMADESDDCRDVVRYWATPRFGLGMPFVWLALFAAAASSFIR